MALLLALALLAMEHFSYVLARLSVQVNITGSNATIALDGSLLHLTWPRAPSAVALVGGPALDPEFQVDGTDNINNFTQDPAYIARMEATPYYGIQAWMRDLDGASAWHDLRVVASSTGTTAVAVAAPVPGQPYTLPTGQAVTLVAALARPEATARLLFLCESVPCAEVLIDRNDRYIAAHTLDAAGIPGPDVRAYFPTEPLPFAAEDVNLLARLGLATLVLLAFTIAAQLGLSLLARTSGIGLSLVPAGATQQPAVISSTEATALRVPSWLSRMPRARDRWDLLAVGIALASGVLTLFISRVEYQGYPHILDAAALYFQAKIFASGHLAAPAPASRALVGPFMVVHDGRWFAQYAPGTPAVLALGILLQAPWLVEPVLGTLALWAIYQIGRLLFTPATGVLALLLAALSPFFGFIAGSYLSHTVALFFGSFFLLWLLRFVRSHKPATLVLAAACLGALGLTRELSAVQLGFGATLPLVALYRQALWKDRARVLAAALLAATALLTAALVYLLYNLAQTGDALLTPRSLFFAADRYGFGPGIGFYGRHTLAAGLVNLHQLLTVLLIDLSGWPFYLTLAFVPLAFLGRDANRRWEVFLLWLAALIVLAQVGYFYHGIYLGPRYIYEALPFLMLLTARGILALPSLLARVGTAMTGWSAPRLAGAVVGAALALLVACNIFYYYPRQLALYQNYSGLPASMPVDTAALYTLLPAHAIVVTDNWYVYNYDLWPLNDPDLRGSTLYAYATSAAEVDALRAAYPNRTMLSLLIAPDGRVSLAPLHD